MGEEVSVMAVPPKCAVRSVVPAGWPIEQPPGPTKLVASARLRFPVLPADGWPFVFIMWNIPDKGLATRLLSFVFCDWSIRVAKTYTKRIQIM